MKKIDKPNIINFSSLAPQRGPRDGIAGQIVSLNMKKGSMFAIGDIHLTPTNYWATISPGMDKEYYEVLHRGLEYGSIVAGKRYVPSIEKDPKVLNEYWEIVKQQGKSKDVIEKLKLLVKNKSDRNFSIDEIAAHLQKKEVAGRNRKEVLALITDLASYSEHSLRLPETEDKEGKITIEKGPQVKINIPKNLPKPPTLTPDTAELDSLLK
jgi:hypothetical protein